MTATANEEDCARARKWLGSHCGLDCEWHWQLAAQFAAVRAPLEARIAELEAEKLRGAFAMLGESPKLALAHKRMAELEIALIEGASEWRNEAAKAREAALRDAAAAILRCGGPGYESVILALIDAPAVKP